MFKKSLAAVAVLGAFAGSALAADVQLGWNDYEDVKTGATEGNNIITGVGYEYPLSKRTFVYGGAGYYMDSYDKVDVGHDDKASVAAVNAGLVHKF